ncbi:rod shape-determining protein MreC [Lentibacillus sp. N15]|uniref:rod shape-determining protein MreC n=1 Tax=Lentibacillus songyuanensis TaxID=3136161 RepID=UPI0031BACB47
MPFFRKKRLFIILIGFIILVALIGFSLKDRDNLSTPEQFIKDTVGMVQSVIHTPVKFVTDIFSNIDDVKNTYKENQLLKEKLAEYKSLIYEVQEIKEENKELHKTLDKTESIRDFHPIQARVMSRTPERWVDQVTINKGTQDGVKKNMAVITADGMIGKIQSVSAFSSTVQLLTGFDQFNRISATISREGKKKNVFGLIEEFDEESNSLLFKIIDESDKDLKKGEVVVSSGMGGVFPAGLTIGTVKKVVPDEYGLTQTALIKPAANMYEINHVIVVDRDLTDKDEAKQDQGDNE